MATNDLTRGTGSSSSSQRTGGIGGARPGADLQQDLSDVRRTVRTGTEHVREGAAELRQGVAELREGVEESVAYGENRVRRAVHSHPGRSLSMALGAGVLLGLGATILASRAIRARRQDR